MQEILLPGIRLRWIRGRDKISFKRPHTFLNLGQRASGKSSLLETVATRYPKIIDLFGSRDNEGLAWCRSPFKDSVLFITGDSVEVKSEWPSIKISQLRLSDFKEYRIILTASCFFSSLDEHFHGLNQLIDTLYKRTHWKQPWFLMIREAANFIYSRVKLVKNQTIAKADFIYLLREARHMGYAVGVDTVRWTAIDIEIRDAADYIFLKRVGVQGLPYDLHWLYKYIDPYSMMGPKPETFVLVSNRGPIAIGKFGYPPWHKEEKENIARELGIKIEYGEVPDYGEPNLHTVSDFEHANIIEKRGNEISMEKIAKALHRSKSTIKGHVDKHNEGIKERGYCIRCRRVKSMYERERVK